MVNTTVVLELAEESIFKLLPLVMMDLRRETKAHDKVIEELSGCSFSRFIFCRIRLCIFCKMIHDYQYVLLTSLTLIHV